MPTGAPNYFFSSSARTGQRFLAGLNSDEAMFRHLMDNAIASKQALNLSVGISLTAEQVAALTHDLVWLEEYEVNGEKVLVPVLYLAQAEGRLAPNGALIQGRDVTLISGGELNNQGTLRASGNLDLSAGNIHNTGLMQAGERLSLLAVDSIRNAQGGIIAGRDVSAIALTGDIGNERSVTTHESAERGYTHREDFVSRASRIEAANDLALGAGRDIQNIGGALIAGRDLKVDAGRDLLIVSAQEHDLTKRVARKSNNRIERITQHASDVSAGRDLTLSTERDLAVVASRVNAGQDLALVAGGDATIASAANESHYEAHRRSGGKKVDIERSTVTQQGAELSAGGALHVEAGHDLTAVASELEAGDEAYLVAGNDLSLLTAENIDYSYFYKKKKSGGLFSSSKTKMSKTSSSEAVSTSIQSGSDLTLVANNDIGARGAQLSSDEAVALYAGHDIILDSAENAVSQASGKSKSRLFSSKASSKSSENTSLTSTSLDGKSVELSADNDITLRAAAIHAEEGITLDAGRDIAISTAQQSQQSSQASKSSKLNVHLTDSLATNGSFTLENKAKGGQQRTIQEVGSTLSGGTIDIDSGRDTQIKSSTLVADDSIRIDAGRNLSVISGESRSNSSANSSSKNAGEIGTWYHGTAGVASLKQANQNSSTVQRGSQIASLGGNVDLNAKEHYGQVASQVIAPEGDVNIRAKQVDILAGYDQLSSNERQSSSRTAVGGSVSVPLVDAVRNIQQMSEAAGNTSDSRLTALAAVNTAMNAQRAYASAQALANGNLTGIKISVNLSNSKGNSSSAQSGQNVVSSTVAAGGDVNVSAVGDGKNSSLNVVGSQIEAAHNVNLKAGGDINLLAAQNTAQQRGDNANSGWSAGIGFGIGGTQNGFTLDLAANKGKGFSEGYSATQSNTEVSAGNKASLASGTDTNLNGAVISGSQVQAQVGGDLNLVSLQDADNYKSKQVNASVGVSLCIPPFCYGMSSGSAAGSQQKIDSTYSSVNEQTGIKAGDGGFQLNVIGNTDLQGAVVASTDKAVADGKNSLTTGTLTHSDIKNQAEYNASSISLSGGYSGAIGQGGNASTASGGQGGNEAGGSVGKDRDGNASATAGGKSLPSENGISAGIPVILTASGEDSSITRSGISGGVITITDGDKQQQLTGQSAEETVASINRDVSSDKDGSNTLDKIFDREEIEAGFEITGQFIRNVGTFLEDRSRESTEAKKQLEAEQAKPIDQRDPAKIAGLILEIQDNRTWEVGGTGRALVSALSAAAGGNITGGSAQMLQNAAINYLQGLAAEQVKHIADELDSEVARTALHAVVGCAGAAAQSQNCGAGALGGSASVVLNNLLDALNSDSTSTLTDEEKQSRLNLVSSLVAGITVAAGGDAVAASNAAQIESANNHLSDDEMQRLAQSLNGCERRADCTPIVETYLKKHYANKEQLQSVCAVSAPACRAMAAEIYDAIQNFQELGYYSELDGQAKDILLAFQQFNLEGQQEVTALNAIPSAEAIVESLGFDLKDEKTAAVAVVFASILVGKAGAKGTGTAGKIKIEPGAIPDANEVRAGQGLSGLGYDVTHQTTASAKGIQGQRTADLHVDGIGSIDVYTPQNLNPTKIVRAIEKKANQAGGVLVQADLPSTDMSSIAARMWGKTNAQSIKTIFFQKPDGTLVRFDRPVGGG